MPKYIIEREIPGAGHLTGSQLEAIIQVSNDALTRLGPQIQWEQSYLTDDKLYCIYTAPDKEVIRDHARSVGIPANRINEIIEVIDATTHPADHALHELWYYE
jgi:Protein of unknown function (DUF4242)